MFRRQRKEFVSSLHLPEDVFLGEMLLYLTGSTSAVVENYRSILYFSDTVLKLKGKHSRLTVSGTSLTIEYYDREQLKITGRIRAVEFDSI